MRRPRLTMGRRRRLPRADAARGFVLLGGGAGVGVLRCVVVRVAGAEGERHLLLVNVHHVAFDGASSAVLLREVGALYVALSTAGGRVEDAHLEEPRVQYADYALWQRDSLSPLLEPQREYWRVQLREGSLPVLDMPLDLSRPAVQTFAGGQVPLQLSGEVAARLEAVGRTTAARSSRWCSRCGRCCCAVTRGRRRW